MLTYTPRAPADYGTLQCWGRNELGRFLSISYLNRRYLRLSVDFYIQY